MLILILRFIFMAELRVQGEDKAILLQLKKKTHSLKGMGFIITSKSSH